MKLEAVTVCVNYSDYFCWTVKENKHLFSKWVVVTDTKDHLTHKICNDHGLTCIKTDIFYQDGGFAKFKGINEGLKHLDKDGWVLFLDADIAIPHIAKRVLNELKLDKDSIYSVDRVDCTGLSKWIKYSNNPNMVLDNWLLTNGGMEVGARIVHYYGQQGENGRFGGYKPLGYFQLVHSSSFEDYPADSKGADHCDMVFTNRYPREKRHLIPEFYCIHLESPNSSWGDNWQGRKSIPFGADMKIADDQLQVQPVTVEIKPVEEVPEEKYIAPRTLQDGELLESVPIGDINKDATETPLPYCIPALPFISQEDALLQAMDAKITTSSTLLMPEVKKKYSLTLQVGTVLIAAYLVYQIAKFFIN